MPSAKKPRPINLALQGGGSHGAYTWGVLDRLLEEDSISIEGISGTSAGAMNAAILISGYTKGGREGARKALDTFWWQIAELGMFSFMRPTPVNQFMHNWNLDDSPGYVLYDLVSRLASPYLLNPFNLNPVRQVLEEQLDVRALKKQKDIKLFVNTTSVRTGQARVFHCHEITIDTLLASACLPFVFQAIEVQGGAFWDGGYSANPALWPLIYHCKSHDIVLVQINPFTRDEVPTKASEIIDRMNEITFNSSLLAEFRAIRFVSKLINKGHLDESHYKDLRMHLIAPPDEVKELNASSKLNTDWNFFRYLKEFGRKAADGCLKLHLSQIGVKSSFNLDEVLDFKHQPDSEGV